MQFSKLSRQACFLSSLTRAKKFLTTGSSEILESGSSLEIIFKWTPLCVYSCWRLIFLLQLTVSVPAFVDNSPLKESRKIKPKTPTSSKGKAPKGHRPVSSEIQHHKPDIQTRKVLLDFEKFRGILEKLTEELIGERMLTEQKEIDEFIRWAQFLFYVMLTPPQQPGTKDLE